jgi:VanZ family protein
LYVLLMFFVSSRPYLRPPGPDFALKDKVAHFGEYYVLGMLLFGAIGFAASRNRMITFLFLLSVGASVGALDEMLQSYVPGRVTDVTDWAADATGVCLGVATAMLASPLVRRLRPSYRGGHS